MLNVYVHLAVRGMPPDVLEDDAVLGRLWGELPDAAFGGERGAFGITLSQFSINDGAAARRQAWRVKHALDALGFDRADVFVEATTREDWKDDLRLLKALISDYAVAALRHLIRR